MAFTGMVNWKKDGLDKPEKKSCKKCKIEKVLDDFYRKRESIDGRSSICKACDDVRVSVYKERKKADRDLYGLF